MKDSRLASILIGQLVKHEGIRDDVYVDSTGHRTIGVGHNLDSSGLCYEAIVAQLVHDIEAAELQLEALFAGPYNRYDYIPSALVYNAFPSAVKLAFLDLIFNIGPHKFAGFKKMIAAARVGDWPQVLAELLDSKWATQVQSARVDQLCKLIKSVYKEV